MTTRKTLTLAAVLIVGATSLAMAQNETATGANGGNGMPPEGYKGPGGMPTYSASDFQGNRALLDRASGGSARGTGRTTGGTSGNGGMPPGSYKGPGAMPTYSASDFR